MHGLADRKPRLPEVLAADLRRGASSPSGPPEINELVPVPLTAAVWSAQEAWAKAHKKFEPRDGARQDERRPGKGAPKKGTPRKENQRAEKPEYEAEKPEYEDGGFEAPEAWKDETPVIGVAQAAFEAAGIVPAPSLAPIQ